MSTKSTPNADGIVYDKPGRGDGKYFWEIAKASKTLDVNSVYHYLIMCRHFGNTCMAAKKKWSRGRICRRLHPPGITGHHFCLAGGGGRNGTRPGNRRGNAGKGLYECKRFWRQMSGRHDHPIQCGLHQSFYRSGEKTQCAA